MDVGEQRAELVHWLDETRRSVTHAELRTAALEQSYRQLEAE